MFCANCGTKVENGAKFCQACGSAVKTVEPAVSEKAGPIVRQVQRKKHGWKPVVIVTAIVLVVSVMLFSVTSVVTAEKNKPLNRILTAVKNTLAKENFSVSLYADDHSETI